MSMDQPPTTLTGIKRRAKKVKRAVGITHTAALNQVAITAGYASYADAHSKLTRDNAA